jgi:hypothetical protein
LFHRTQILVIFSHCSIVGGDSKEYSNLYLSKQSFRFICSILFCMKMPFPCSIPNLRVRRYAKKSNVIKNSSSETKRIPLFNNRLITLRKSVLQDNSFNPIRSCGNHIYRSTCELLNTINIIFSCFR